MTKMKDSGIEWIGEVPEEWGGGNLKYYFDVQLGKMLQPSAINGNDIEINYLRAINVQWDNISVENLSKMWCNPSEVGKYEIKNGDLLVCEGGEVGRCGIVEHLSDRAIIQNAVHRIRPTEKADVRFLNYYIQHTTKSKWFDILCNKATIAHLTSEKLLNTSVVLPSISEQTQIADFLDKKVAQLGSVKSLLEEQIKTLEDYRQSLIYETVTKGLDKTVPLKEVDNKWISVIPSDWEERKLRYLAQTRNEKNLTENSDSYVGLENITPRTGLYIETESEVDLTENISFKQGDILFGKLRPYLRKFWKAEFDGTASSEFIIFKDSILDLEFLYWAIQSDSFVNDVNSSTYGSKMPRASWEYIKEIKIPFPVSQNEQKSIVKFLNEKVVQTNQMIAIKKEQIENINKQRQTLIYDYVTGKRRV